MSELKVHNINNTSLHDITTCDFYLKSEADSVIAEKDAEIVELKKQVHDYALGSYVIQARAEKEARHDKYKRCLCNSKACLYLVWYYDEAGFREASNRMWKWHNRWLDIAEKFKEK